MTRRRFGFWIGFGLYGLAQRAGASEFDRLAAALMESFGPKPAMPVHWQTTHNGAWRWIQREHFINGEWRLTGMTTPVRRDTGEPLEEAVGYLDEAEVPAAYRTAYDNVVDANGDPLPPPNDEGISASEDAPGPDAASHRRARHGRPPSRWLRTLESDELAIWLATVDPPEAGVNGMTFEEHLTRDHGFESDRIAGLDGPQLAKLHAAAHHGY